MYAIIAGLLVGAIPSAGPLAAVAPAADRGEVRTGPPLSHTFELTHRGPAGVVTVTGVEVGCGCLKPTVSRRELRPGDRCEVGLTVNTLTQPAGPNLWRAVVRYRVDPAPEGAPPTGYGLELTVSASLVREVSVTPPAVALSTAGEASQIVTVTDRRPAPLRVLAVATTRPQLAASLGAATADGGARSQPVEVRVAADFPPGESDETVVLTTDDPGCPELRIPVRVVKRTVGAVTASPAALDVRFARGQAEASTLLQLRRPDGGAVRVDRVEGGSPAVRAKWADAAGVAATVRVVVSAAAAGERSGRSEVRVVLTEPAGYTVTVPVIWSVP